MKYYFLLSFLFLFFFVPSFYGQNPIVIENQNPGNPTAEWSINGIEDQSIMGFATDISVNKGTRVHFKIKTAASGYSINIFRIGYYQGNGARKVGTGVVTASLPQNQPNGIYDAATGLLDCGNWAESGYWDVPPTAVSGIYTAKLTRSDNGSSQQITFIVRDDQGSSDLLYQTSDATWQAYNTYGDTGPGNSFYAGSTTYPRGRAVKLSYNRPFNQGVYDNNFFYTDEYAMVRWLERNGYNVSYTTCIDSDRRGSLIKNHKVFLSVGHDEYWSGAQRSNVEAAQNAGVNLAFFSGDEVSWKTRWENSIDGSGSAFRTLVCYKEGTDGAYACGNKCDPLPTVWTGLWSFGCEYNIDGCKPQYVLTGQSGSYIVDTGALMVPYANKDFRFWRNTSIANLAAGQTAAIRSMLGYEIDYEQTPGSYPAGRVRLSQTNVASGIVHKLSLYRRNSGALVFAAGTIGWAWGLESDRGTSSGYGASPDIRIQQATVNVLADMGTQPGNLQAGLIAATYTTDRQSPTTVITSPAKGAIVKVGTQVTVRGTATKTPGVIATVEVSTDGGVTWNEAIGSTNWSYIWTPGVTGNYNIKSRAVDDMGNLETSVTTSNSIPTTIANGIRTDTVVIACKSFTWNRDGVTYTQSTTRNYIFNNTQGGQDTITLKLTINNGTRTDTLVTACKSFTWNRDGVIYSQSTTRNFSFTNSQGCQDTVTLKLTIINGTRTDTLVTACKSFIWNRNGINYKQSGNYNFSFTNTQGCQDTVTLKLTINNGSRIDTLVTACKNFTWNRNGINYTQSGNYNFSFTNTQGCQDTVTLRLTINNGSRTDTVVNACKNFTWNRNNITYTQSVNYNYIFTNSQGCQDTVTLRLTINNGSRTDTVVSACKNFTWNRDGVTYTQSTTRNFRFTNIRGCQDTVTLKLTIYNGTRTDSMVTACKSFTWNRTGVRYTQSGNYNFSFTNSQGCRDTVTLKLTINNGIRTDTLVTACTSFTWDRDGVTYTQSTTRNFTFTNIRGCQDTVTLRLTINNGSRTDTFAIACQSFTWDRDGVTYTQNVNQGFIFTNYQGCQDTVTLNLTINNGSRRDTFAIACQSFTWDRDGVTYAQNVTQDFIFTNDLGCQDTVTLNLTINNGTRTDTLATACQSFTWDRDGVTYTQNVIQDFIFTNDQGCQDTVTLNLTITGCTDSITLANTGSRTDTLVTACNNFTWDRDGITYTQNVIKDFNFTNAQGGQDTITLNLNINQCLDTVPTITNSIVTIPDLGGIPKVKSSKATSTNKTGSTSFKFKSIQHDLSVKVFPNPAAHIFTLRILSTSKLHIDLRVLDFKGKIIEVFRNINANNDLQLGTNYPDGIYFIEAIQGEDKKTIKLIKQSK